ncbi:N-acetyltransferase [Altererythrobacter aquiaggeris]|uniref:GNAT family N-acetyltransferase n=1 Tax=Aestuarierythrobacter aquiaggeris TaxID=1898396 RepID=UPI00301881F8
MTAITIRPEQAGDENVIHDLTKAAFAKMEFSDGDEPALVGQLRDDGDLTLSLVALDADGIVGHIAFSPVTISDGSRGWYGLGPVSVTPELQRQGTGSALIERGIADLRAFGARGIILLGSPLYYSRFGFEHDPKLQYPGPPAEYFQRLVLAGSEPRGVASFAPAFG